MDDEQLAQRFGAIERQLRMISAHLGVDCPPFPSDGLTTEPGQPPNSWSSTQGAGLAQPGLPADIVELASSGHKIEAIKRLRALTGASLLEAKRAVDALER